MPETAIALFPDIGATFFLPRMPGALGMYLALTGARITGTDAVHAGFGTHFCPRARLQDLSAAIAADGVAAIAGFAEPLPAFSLAPHRPVIDRAFSAHSVKGIFAALEDDGGDFAMATLSALRAVSPSSLHWSFKILRDGAVRTLEECLEAELELVQKITRHPEFFEGVRAVVVDKDRAPKWKPASVEEIDEAAIEKLFD
jgi:enoyl-CoA hydratase/carnithine racemase